MTASESLRKKLIPHTRRRPARAAVTWTNEIAAHRAPFGACGAAQLCTPMSMRHGTSDSAVRCLSAPCSSRRRLSSPNWCANSVNEGCIAPDPVGRVPPPTRDCRTPTSVEESQSRPGCQVRQQHQIWCLLCQLDSALFRSKLSARRQARRLAAIFRRATLPGGENRWPDGGV